MTEQVFTIPLTSIPQAFSITLGGRQLNMVNKWNEDCGWLIDIYDGVTEESLVMAIPLITGADLLEQFTYIGIPGSLIVSTDGDELAPPTLDNLGGECNLFYLVDV